MSVLNYCDLTSSKMARMSSTEEYSMDICPSTCTDRSKISLMVSGLVREWCLVRSLWISCTWSLSFWISVCKVWLNRYGSMSESIYVCLFFFYVNIHWDLWLPFILNNLFFVFLLQHHNKCNFLLVRTWLKIKYNGLDLISTYETLTL